MAHHFHVHYCPLVQCFSTRVPRNPRVASVCQGFRSWPVTNNLACEITPDNVVEILSVDFFCLKLRFYASFCIDLLCWIIFVVSKILTYLHFRLKPIS